MGRSGLFMELGFDQRLDTAHVDRLGHAGVETAFEHLLQVGVEGIGRKGDHRHLRVALADQAQRLVPSITGMLISISTISGRSRSNISTASCPLSACCSR